MARRATRIDKSVASWPKPVPVKDWMAQPAVTIGTDATCREAIDLMKSRHIRHLPVVDRGRLVGIVTDRDLRQVVFDPAIQEGLGQDDIDILDTRAVRDVMSWAVLSVGPDTDLRQAARLMHEQKIGALPVVEAGRVLGILTERDVLRAFAALTPQGVTRARPLEADPDADDTYEYGFPRPGEARDQ
jgi:acetoin utilization protein AcuB